MFTDIEFEAYLERLNIPATGRRRLRTIRTSPPERRVRASSRNTTMRYASHKMGWTIQAESTSVEYRLVLLLEYDDDVIEYYDQPTNIKLNYKGKDGRNRGHRHTPDYCVIRHDGISFIECKPDSKMADLHANNSHRYLRGPGGEWRCPPGEEAAAEFGFSYEVWTPSKMGSVLFRNLVFLEDYLLDCGQEVDQIKSDLVRLTVRDQPGITLDELLQLLPDNHTDALYYSIAHRRDIYVDLTVAPLGEPDIVQLYPNVTCAEAQRNLLSSAISNAHSKPDMIDVAIGSVVMCNDDRHYRIVAMNDREVTVSKMSLQSEQLEMETILYETLIRDCKVVSTTPKRSMGDEGRAIYAQASTEAFDAANYRFSCLLAEEAGDDLPLRENGTLPGARTIRRWQRRYERAEQLYGFGYLGLLPHTHRQGNRESRLTPAMEELIDTYIRDVYNSNTLPTVRKVWLQFKKSCKEAGLTDAEIPSFKTFNQRVRDSRSPDQKRRREGKKAAYQVEPPLWLSYDTPLHGDRPFEIVHIDHTQLDVELRCSKTGALLGRPWLTMAVDAYSRRILAVYLSYESPSTRSVMMLLREIVRRYRRLPQTVVVDGGKEFSSTYFETLLGLYGVSKRERVGNPRGGSVVERLFKSTNTEFVHMVKGSTQLMKNVREVSAEVQPKELAVWSLPLFYKHLRYWAYEVYDTTTHKTLGQSPRDMFIYGLKRSGERTHTLISYDDFKLLSLPAPTRNGGCRTVDRRVGIRVHYLTYWCVAFKNPKLWGTKVKVRYDPFNFGVVYALVDSEWQECRSQFDYQVRYRTEKEMEVASKAARRIRGVGQRAYSAGAQLADFWEMVSEDERVLSERRKARENHQVLAEINNDPPPLEGAQTDRQKDDTEDSPEIPIPQDYSDIDVFPEY